MDVHDTPLPDDPAALKQLLIEQQRQSQKTIAAQQKLIDRYTKDIDSAGSQVTNLREKLERQKTRIEILEEQLKLMQIHRFGKRSEKFANPDQLQFFNEAEIVADEGDAATTDPTAEVDGNDENESITVPAHTRRKHKPSSIPPELPRVDVVHDLDEDEKRCTCGEMLENIGEEVTEQLCVVPQQHFAVRHRRLKYACQCKHCIRTATMPAQPVPGSQASPRILANVMVRKYLEAIPLYRQEKIAERDGLSLPRHKLARWMIDGSAVFQPLLNLIEEAFFSYDIALSDDTGIQVLKEDGRAASNQSALWIRRGGPPHKPCILVDYDIAKSGDTAYRLLSEFTGYLVSDGASNFNQITRRNQLVTVLCNDHARRRFERALRVTDAGKGSIARTAMHWYGKLYRLERHTKHLDPADRLAMRQSTAAPIWEKFLEWATKIFTEGVSHGRTREALAYLLTHKEGLQRYLIDGRLPISNILSEHVAKSIAIARKNFLFADTPSGAKASARIFSMIETARANGHHPYKYLSVVLTELPQAKSVEDVERLLPWTLSPDQVALKFAVYPQP